MKTHKKYILTTISLLTIIFLSSLKNIKVEYIDPTGIYKYGQIEKNEKNQKYFGEIQVLALSKDKIIVSLFLCKGYPSYNSGSFIDTLEYKENKTIYFYPKTNPTCKIYFNFTKKNLIIKQDSINDDCGFGNGVYADCLMKKTSSLRPKIVDLAQ
jgi:hypothetical protein